MAALRRVSPVAVRPGEGPLTLMSEVKGRGSALAFRLTAGRISNCNWLHRVGDGALRRRSIKLLFAGSAFRVSVSGLVLCLNGGRRAQPGHVVRDRGSPPWLHPRRCAALRFLLSTASTAGSSNGCDLSRAPRRSGLRASAAARRVGLYRGGALEHAG